MADEKYFRGAYLLTGGVTGALDSEPVATFKDLDATFVQTDGVYYPYSFDLAATNIEEVPLYIRPDDYSTSGVHVLQSLGIKNVILEGGSMLLKEQSVAIADVAGYGQLWVKDDTPNTLWFTDDEGNDLELGGGGGGGDALTSNPLSQFAATTSAQLAGVISDETGSGSLVFGSSPTIVTPTIASLTNMQHSHLNAAGGGTITEASISDLQSYLLDLSGSPLSELSDVTITGIASGELLKWNGAAWINNTLAEAGIGAAVHTHTESDITDLQSYLLNLSGSPLSELSDVTITGIASGELLRWNGSAWINNTLAEAGISATGHGHTESDITDLQSYYVPGGTDVAITDGGTGQSTAQLAINALSAVAGATDEYVLTKDTGTGNALWKVATGGSGLGTNLSSTTNDIASDTGIIELKGTGNTNNENLLLDFETTANEVGISSSTGVTNFNFTGTIELEPTTSSTTGVIYKGADRFIHNFQHPTGNTAVPIGLNTCIGVDAGNFTMGSTATEVYHGSYNNFIGSNSGRSNTIGYSNNFMGADSGYSNTTGHSNNFMGVNSGLSNTIGNFNNFMGYDSGRFNTTGNSNNFMGSNSGRSNTTGNSNNFMGYNSGRSNTTGHSNNFMAVNSGFSNTAGHSNNFMGVNSGYSNTIGTHNNFIGYQSGRYYNGTTGNNTTSVYCTLIGGNTSVSADGVQRETVLGYNAIGKGSDTAIIGAEATNDRVYLSGGLTVNDAGADYDTNIATVAGANSLVVQGSDGFVGVGIGTPNEALSVEGIINVPKASGNGIKIDTTAGNSDWGWHDLLGTIHTRPAAGGGAAAVPDYVAYRGNIYAHRFGTLSPASHLHEAFVEFHMPHDHVVGTDIFLHVHWSQIVVDTGGAASAPGVAEWQFDVSYSKGHGVAGGAADPFIAEISPTITQQGSTTQYGHMIAELQLSAASPSATQLDTDNLEIDGLILVRLFRDPGSGSDTLDQHTFVHYVDIHYQSTGIPTKQKAPDFYT